MDRQTDNSAIFILFPKSQAGLWKVVKQHKLCEMPAPTLSYFPLFKAPDEDLIGFTLAFWLLSSRFYKKGV